jgi:hypothetical protein
MTGRMPASIERGLDSAPDLPHMVRSVERRNG